MVNRGQASLDIWSLVRPRFQQEQNQTKVAESLRVEKWAGKKMVEGEAEELAVDKFLDRISTIRSFKKAALC